MGCSRKNKAVLDSSAPSACTASAQASGRSAWRSTFAADELHVSGSFLFSRAALGGFTSAAQFVIIE
jgi:hypothetical protein